MISGPHKNRFAKQGITLLEIVVATMITGAMLVASLNSVGAVFQTQRLNADRLKGPGLAHELMSEILAMPYKDPDANTTTIGTDAGESTANRSTFDDVDDYHGLNSLGIKAKNGTNRTGYTNWRQQASVVWVESLTGIQWGLSDTGLKRISVTITSPTGEVKQLTAYRAKDGVLEQAPLIDTSAVTWVGAELQLGTATTPVRMGTNLTNHTPDAD